MKRVLLDCDGVLADFIGRWASLVDGSASPSFAPTDLTAWDLGLPDEQRPAAKRLIAACPGFAASLAVLPGALDGVIRLREVADVYIVTSPWNSHPTWTHDREAWLKKHFDISSKHVVHTSAKHLVCGDMLVDDKTEACDAWRAAWPQGVAVQWSTPHNQRDMWDGPSTSDWDFLIDLVKGLS